MAKIGLATPHPRDITRRTYYLTGYVRIDAADDDEADRKFKAAGLGIDVEIADGVTLDFQGPWDEVVETPRSECICLPELLARGGFNGSCPVHRTP